MDDNQSRRDSLPWERELTLGYEHVRFKNSFLVHADAFEWLSRAPEGSIHAIVTDPPYGVKEYEADQLEKRSNGKGGIWRIPPAFDGSQRAPLPRFTALTPSERKVLSNYFETWSRLVVRVVRPGGHVFIASNAFISQLVFSAVVAGGLEFRGELIRMVRTLRGGDRPKNGEAEFPGVSSMAKGCYEPWGIFRKPLPSGMTVTECLREFGTGGLRRTVDDKPFEDVVQSERTPRRERDVADHPSIKPQSLMRKLVYSSLPLGTGVVLDPYAGSGSTLAAAEAVGVSAIGIERHGEYFNMAKRAVPMLAALYPESKVKSGASTPGALF